MIWASLTIVGRWKRYWLYCHNKSEMQASPDSLSSSGVAFMSTSAVVFSSVSSSLLLDTRGCERVCVFMSESPSSLSELLLPRFHATLGGPVG